MLTYITPLILTYNEAPNIDRTLQHLIWATRIVVIDSYSTDETLEILKRYSQVEIFQRKFDTHANQWNHGLSKVHSEWVLSLDADYILSNRLIEELKFLPQSTSIEGYFISFKYCVFGKALRGTILPPRLCLFKKNKVVYVDDGHTQVARLDGQSDRLSSSIHHDDRKPLSRWIWAQERYMLLEVTKLLETPRDKLSRADRIRKQKILAPFIVLVYCLILKGGILDGWQGWYYAFQRMFAEVLLSLRLIEAEHFKGDRD
ncbi:glycosyltransferase family 2 protein [Oscillatoriales cyanobacterium LEGE 11467]|uniref:Glycosyltransferase family 2 protein n=1 Tax=Zarconia navalis LEGE 11467 TaxID=1828826 RepID=A0A928VWW0_9CYAN|nr:glycosyltransferase family 2 protein [Zarconia navalis]MBE9041616.1 glycosyltransferase family 2 protein [Zarconia navalis LEGE 11467]